MRLLSLHATTMPPFCPLCLSLALLAGAVPASANETSEISRLLGLSLEDLINTPVVTASRQTETRSQSPAHIMLITREQIRERRYRNLADLMEDLPGVDFMRGTKSSAYNNFAVQGYAGSNKMLVMLDGVRVGHPAGGTFPIAENFALYLARQVEVLYGPAAALYGADAVAGVINIITDKAADAPGASVSLSGGNFGRREASFIASIRNENKLALSMGGHSQKSDRAPLEGSVVGHLQEQLGLSPAQLRSGSRGSKNAQHDLGLAAAPGTESGRQRPSQQDRESDHHRRRHAE